MMKIMNGPGKIEVQGPAQVQIWADASFMAYGLDEDGETKTLLGPFKSDARVLFCQVSDEVAFVKIVTSKNTSYQVDVSQLPPRNEVPDPRPVADVLPSPKELSLDEKIKLAVETVVSQRMADAGIETIEEANDFDVDDDLDDVLTPYEAIEMKEEFPVDPEEVASESLSEPHEQDSDADPEEPPSPSPAEPAQPAESSGA